MVVNKLHYISLDKLTDIGENKPDHWSDISLFPNPALNILNIANLPHDFDGSVTIFNTLGQILCTEKKYGSQFSIDLGILNKGIYFLQVRSGSGHIVTRKFIIQ